MEKAIQDSALPITAAHRSASDWMRADPRSIRWQDLMSGPGPLLALCARALSEQSWFIFIVLIYMAIGFALAAAYAQRVSLSIYDSVHMMLYASSILVIIIYRTIRCLIRLRPVHPLPVVLDDLTGDLVTPWRAVSSLPAIVLVQFVLSMHSSLKRLIPLINPYTWDPIFAEMDRIVHGGYQPWELLQPIFSAPLVTYALSISYTLPWYTAIVVLQLRYTFSLNPQRLQFFLTYVLCWSVLGTGMAILFSSVGPPYYGYFVNGVNPYAPLFADLSAVNQVFELPTSMAQSYLWDSYQQDSLSIGSGISAMPSMHVSIAFLMVLVSWRAPRLLRATALAYLVVVMAGSVYLGWHYAIDGYVSIALTGAIWAAVSRGLAWRARRASTAVMDHHMV